MSEEKKKRDFSNFKLKVQRTPTNERSYQRYAGRMRNSVQQYTDEELIKKIIDEGDPATLREVSRYYARISGIYKNTLLLLSNLLFYDTVVSPVFDPNKKLNKEKTITTFNRAVKFVDDMNVPVNFSRITYEILSGGVYYGILRVDTGDGVTIQDLPVAYCRTRFKNSYNLDIPEFNVQYFERITDKELQKEALAAYPAVVRAAYAKWKNGKLLTPWVEILPEYGGMCFYYEDQVPLLISSIPTIIRLSEAENREAKRDENELYKLLIQKMPVDSNGELVFQLEEIYDIHDSIAEMLQSVDTVDVLTTFGDTKLESIQDSSAATQSSDRLEKYQKATYDELGRSSLLFNSDGSSSLPYSIKKDEALMFAFARLYSAWIEYQINLKYAKSNLRFSFTILPTTIYNRETYQSQYFSGAQYGYSKMYAGVALGIKQPNLISLISFENDFLNMTEKMIPLQSSYTTSGKDIKNEENAENKATSSGTENITDEGGRPALKTEEKSEKTMSNIENKEQER